MSIMIFSPGANFEHHPLYSKRKFVNYVDKARMVNFLSKFIKWKMSTEVVKKSQNVFNIVQEWSLIGQKWP